MSAARKVIYWQDVVGDEAIINEYREDIARLLAGEYTACGIEKLNDYNVYSMRLNKKGRLLFTTIEDDGLHYVVILEVLPNHEYDSSRFLQHGVLQRYLQKNMDKLLEQAATSHKSWSSVSDEDAEKLFHSIKKEEGNIEFVAKKYYQHRFIQLNVEQEEAITARLPLIISGCAGAGKTCVALTILTQMLHQLDGEEGDLLYVAQQPELVERMQRTWSQMTALDPSKSQRVQFKTYEQLILEQNPSLKNFTRVGEDEFIDTIKKRIALYKKLSTTKEEDKIAIAEIEKRLAEVYQEARILSAYSLEEYCDVGRNSLFTDTNERKWLYAAFDFYQKGLSANKKYDPSLQKFNLDKKYKFIVTDEAQDLSTRQLKTLHELTEHSCFCMDSHQSLEDAQSKRPHLFRILINPSHIELPYSERCLPAIAKVANVIIDIKNSATGGKADKLEYCKMETRTDGKQGEVEWIENIRPEDIERIKKKSKKSDRAVIIPDESLRAEAEKIYNTTLVFTIEQIKGSEYDTVIVHGMIEDDFKEANQAISQDGLKQNSNRAKDGKSHADLAPPFNRLYTAFTRAKRALIIVQPVTHQNKLICNYLRDAITPLKEEKEHVIEAPVTTKEDWFERAKILFLEGKKDHAKRILMAELEYSEKDYINFALQFEEPEKKDVRRAPDLDIEREKPRKISKDSQPSVVAASPSLAPTLGPVRTVKKFSITLPKKLTPKNLANFFKSPEAIDFLFTVDDKNTFPFMRFYSSKSSDAVTLLGFFLKNPAMAKKIPVHYLYQLLRRDDGKLVTILGALAAGDQHCIGILGQILLGRDDIDFAELCIQLTVKMNDSTFSPLFVLCTKLEGISLLQHIAGKSSFMDHLKVEEFSYQYALSGADFLPRSPDIFRTLCLNVAGVKFLNSYFEHNTERYKSITPAMLLARIGGESTTFPYVIMMQSSAGQTFLNNIVKHNPKIFDHLSIETMLEKISMLVFSDTKTFVSVYLMLLLNPHPIFSLLEKYYDVLAKDFVKQLLLNKDGAKLGAGYPPFELFIIMITRLIYAQAYFLVTLLREKSDLLVLLHQNDSLCQPAEESSFSPITMLLVCDNFYSYILSLFESNPDILLKIPYHELISTRIHANDKLQVPPLLRLSMHEEGRLILKKMLVHSSELRKALSSPDTLANLISFYRQLNDAFQTVSIYQALKKTPTGLEIISMLKESNPALTDEVIQEKQAQNMQETVSKQMQAAVSAYGFFPPALKASAPSLIAPQLAPRKTFRVKLPEKITTKNLLKLLKSAEGIEFLFTLDATNSYSYPFLNICVNPESLSCLNFVLKQNPNLVKKIPIPYLFRFMLTTADSRNVSILAWLSDRNNAAAFELLRLILFNRADFNLDDFYASLICKSTSIIQGLTISSNPLLDIVSNSHGLIFLQDLLKNIPTFKKHLKPEGLREMIEMIGMKFNIFNRLCTSKIGCKIIDSYLDDNPEAVLGLSDTLFELTSVGVGSFCTPFELILKQAPYLDPLLKFAAHNPNFLANIDPEMLFEKYSVKTDGESLVVPAYLMLAAFAEPVFNLLFRYDDSIAKNLAELLNNNSSRVSVYAALKLARNFSGNFLKHLLKYKPDLFELFYQKDVLCSRMAPEYGGAWADVSSITIFLLDENNYSYLYSVIKKHPDILNKIPYNEVTSTYFANKLPGILKLAISESGIPLLRLMLLHNAYLRSWLTSADNLAKIYVLGKADEKTINIISLYQALKASGDEIIELLMTLNPNLDVDEIHAKIKQNVDDIAKRHPIVFANEEQETSSPGFKTKTH